MKLKLSYIQFKALYSIFQQLFNADAAKPKSIEARLMLSILIGIYVKLYKLSSPVTKKKKYSIALNEPEALAFWIFFNKYNFLPEEMIYEANLIDTINNIIHQKFCS